jgi:SAM-dependent methyltransferase
MAHWIDRIYHFNSYNRKQWVASQAMHISAGSRVLDVGAGIGPYRPFFAHCGYYTHDFGNEPGTQGKYTSLDYISDIIKIPVEDSSFDVVLCTEVLEHVPEPILAVKEMARILRSGGRLLLAAPLGSFLHQEPYHFYGGFTPHWYHKFLPQAGFDLVSIESNRGFFSWFGQEALRFSALIDPRRSFGLGMLSWIGLTTLWLVTLPILRVIFPLLGGTLDKLRLEQIATVGYHVTAIRR